ncbi:hypothetical protein [Halovivax limisalsi]|uniref:hypothetical protein n=1 Tax=Halovivax limisalsi TaxID=1453760 RepID=UPI001FFD378B|nr:hypothetical protein [Halovivax limisalsi]
MSGTPPVADRGDDRSAADSIAITFHPQEWVDSPGEAHDWGRRQLVPAPGRDPATFVVPRADAADDDGEPFPDESYEANALRDHPAAPEWVADWDGPYYVTVTDT